MNGIRGAIFDLDGTLIDSLIIWKEIWRKIGVRYFNNENFRPSDEDDKAMRTMTTAEAMDYTHKKYGIGESGKELTEFFSGLLEKFYAEEVKLKEGVKSFLGYLEEHGVKMCVATATDKKLAKVALKHTGIDAFFDEIISCVDVGCGKDKPDIYIAAADRLGTAIGETCVFEDSLTAIQTAKNLGMKTVGIFDRNNYGQEDINKTADEYIAEGENLLKLI